jgi:GIY-YIG catalytic domain
MNANQVFHRGEPPEFTMNMLNPNIVCVYTLYLGDEIVYVGQTQCLRERLRQHLTEKKKKFDSYTFIDLWPVLSKMSYTDGRAYFDYFEAHAIMVSRPTLNTKRPCIYDMLASMRTELVEFIGAASRNGGYSTDEMLAKLRAT